MPFRDKLILTSVFLFTAVLFFSAFQAVNFLITALFLIVCSFYTTVREKKQLLKQRSYLLWMFAFFILILVSFMLSSDTHSAFRYLDSRLPLLYFPLSVGLLRIEKDLRDKALLGIAIIITLVATACFVYGIYRSFTFQNTAYLYNDSLSIPVTGHQSIYISLLVNFAIYIFAWYLFYRRISRLKSILISIILLLLFIISFLLASRNLMVVLYVSTISFALHYIFKRKKYNAGFGLIIGLLICVFLVFRFSPKTLNRFKELTYTQFDYQQTGPESHYNMAVDTSQWNGANTRLAIWECGWQLFKKNPFFGVHLGDKKAKLVEVYREKNFQFAIRTNKNLHNNYFDILVSMGITGLILFLISWIILPVRVAWQHKDGLAVLIMLTVAIAMTTENYFDRSIGGMLFGFFIPFLLSDKTAKN
jgi:O-antigen ligase